MIIVLLDAGVSVTEVARRFVVTRKEARKLRDGFNQTISVKDLQ